MKKTTTPVEVGGSEYETVAASQTDQILGTAGARNDFLARLVLNVIAVATASVTITDGTTAIVVQTANSAVLGAQTVEIGIRATTGPWKITTGAGVTAIAVGHFSV